MLIKENNGHLTTDLYKKPTFPGRYLNFLSNKTTGTKIGIIKNLVNKIFKLSDAE